MNSPLLWLLLGLGAVLIAAWRLVVSRKRRTALIASRESAAELALALARQAAVSTAQAAQAAAPAVTAASAPAKASIEVAAVERARQEPRPQAPATTSAGAPDGVERRSPGRLAADRVIAAEAERRQAAIHKAQHAARVEAERRATEKAARIAASDLENTVVVLNPPATAKPSTTVVAFRAPDATPANPTTTPADAGTRPLAPVVPISRAAGPVPVASIEAVIAEPAAASRAPAPVLKTAEQTLVLLADDSKMVRVKTSKLLAAHGFQILTAVDGLDAVRQLETCLPDLVITDVDMPGMDGFGLTTHLRRTARTAHIPIVMITSAEDRHREEAMRLGVGLVMGKPYPEDELIAHIRSFGFTVAAEQERVEAIA